MRASIRWLAIQLARVAVLRSEIGKLASKRTHLDAEKSVHHQLFSSDREYPQSLCLRPMKPE